MSMFESEVLLDSQIFQRRHRRISINRYVRVFTKDSQYFVGRLMDVTPYGFRLSTYDSIKLNTLKEFELSDLITEDSQDISFEARTKWCQQGDGIGLFDIGFELLYSSPGAQSMIRKLTNTLH